MIGVYNFLSTHCQRSPQKTALVFNDQRYTFAELGGSINKLAYGFHSMGIGKGSKVGILLNNGALFVECVFALWKLGACVSLFSSRNTDEELLEMLQIIDCRMMICSSDQLLRCHEISSQLQKQSGHALCLINDVCDAADNALASLDKLKQNNMQQWDYCAELAADDEIVNVFTGGTTGLPKAAVHTQQSLLLFTLSCYMMSGMYKEEEVFLNYAPLCHIGGLRIMLGTLLIGGTLVLTSVFDADSILQIVEKERVTQMFLIPPNIINRFQEAQETQGMDFSSVRMIRLSGSAGNAAVVERVFSLFPKAEVVVGFGSTEGAISLFNVFKYDAYLQNPNLSNSVGRPLPLCEVRLVDDKGQDVPQGQVGEALGRGPHLLKYYYGKSGIFMPGKWFATGDLLYQDAKGNYYFSGRKKDMIKSGGENVYAYEVENTISRFPGVDECAVIGLPDREYGEIVAAAISVKRGCQVDEKELIAFCKQHIASYKKPRQVFFVQEFPRTRAGKINKPQLREQLRGQELSCEGHPL